MSAYGITAINNVLKEYWGKSNPFLPIFKQYPFIAMANKRMIGGRNWLQTLNYSQNQGVSNTFTSAQTASSAPGDVQFSMTARKFYGIAQIEQIAVEAARSDQYALVKTVEREMRQTADNMMRRLEIRSLRSATGAVARVVSTYGGASTTIGIAAIGDNTVSMNPGSAGFFKNAILVASAANGGALRAAGTNTMTITAVNRGASEITVGAIITGLVAGDYLYFLGDAQNNASDPIASDGFTGWVPRSAPGATAFNGVDRTADVDLLGGLRLNAAGATTGGDVVEVLTEACEQVCFLGGNPDVIHASQDVWVNAKKLLQSQVEYGEVKGRPLPFQTVENGKVVTKMVDIGVSFQGFRVDHSRGSAVVIRNTFLEPKTAYVCQSDTWELGSMMQFPHVYTEADDPRITLANEDAFEIRFNNYLNLACSVPGFNCHVYDIG